MTAPLYYYLMIFVIFMGLCVGSFLNVVIYRVPEGLSIAYPGSRCPSCEHPIRFYDNIPVLSWIILRGKCRDCGAKISPRYALVELFTGLLAWFIWWQLPALIGNLHLLPNQITLSLFAILFLLRFTFVALLITIAFIDLDHFIIPHRFTLTGMLLGLASPWIIKWLAGDPTYLTMWPPVMPIMSVVGLIAGGALIIGIFYLYLVMRGIVGLGGGDATLMAMVGAWLGIPGIIFVCFAASIQGIIAVIISKLFGLNFIADSREILEEHDSTTPSEESQKNQEVNIEINPEADVDINGSPDDMRYAAIPFGPFIALSALEYLLFGLWFPEWLSLVKIYFIFL